MTEQGMSAGGEWKGGETSTAVQPACESIVKTGVTTGIMVSIITFIGRRSEYRIRNAPSFRAIAIIALSTLPAPTWGDDRQTFDQSIRPILVSHCGACHSGNTRTNGFSIESQDAVIAGGKNHGQAVVGGHPEQSVLMKMLRGELSPKMPLGGALPTDQLTAIEAWIKELPASKISTGGSSWLWPFQRPKASAVPKVKRELWVKNPIDAFILEKLEQKSLPPAPPATRPVIGRRLYLDVIGLPPSPDEMKDFLDDNSPAAVEHLVDRLLDDPRYGERWARYWLDLVRYSDSNGLEGDPEIGSDTGNGSVWRYRDWVIEALNQDMPYDEFVSMQIAGGDEKSRRRDKYTYGMRGYIPAVYYRLAPWSLYDNIVSLENRQAFLDEITTTTASVFLGLTMGCARCHDHKYDPIPTKDFYRFEAFFNALKVEDIEVPFGDGRERERAAEQIKHHTQLLENGPEKREFDELRKTFLARLKDEKKAAAKDAKLTAEDLRLEMKSHSRGVFSHAEVRKYTELFEDADRTKDPAETDALKAFEKRLLEKLGAVYANGAIDPLGRFDALDFEDLRRYLPEREGKLKYFTPLERDKYYELHYQIKTIENRLRRWKPLVATVVNVPGPPTEADIQPLRRLIRGDVYRPAEAVQPGFPQAMTGNQEPAQLEIDEFHQYPTRGWRTTLSRWLTSDENPLTARVMVNRVWQHHFGRGLVGTPNDFGRNGERPTHPELLDWLALKFMKDGWSLKSLHRLILNSNTYLQAADNPAVTDSKADPDNQLLWRYRRRRLDAEVIRDGILHVSGALNPEMGGPGVFPPLPSEVAEMGRAVPIGGIMWEANEKNSDAARRSIYTFQRRSLPLPMMSTFDAAVANESCERRVVTTTTLQALTLMNGEFLDEQASRLSARIVQEAGPQPMAQLRRLFQLALGRMPSASETDRWSTFAGPLEAMCRIILNSNEFLYLE